MSRRQRGLRAAAVALAALLPLAGCTSTPDADPTPVPTVAPSASATPTETTPPPPELVPEGDAAANLPYFTHVVAGVWATEDRSRGMAYIDALVAAGFAMADMQLTSDTSPGGHAVDSVQFSVRWGDAQCLIGQVGLSTGEPVAAVMPQLAEGRCLVGETVPLAG